MATVTEVIIYPVKSCAAVSLKKTRLHRGGFQHDRQWCVVSADWGLLTQRNTPKLAIIQPSVGGDGSLTLSAPGKGSIHVPSIAENSTLTSVDVWGESCGGSDQGEAVAAWLSDVLELPCRLIRSAPAQLRERTYADDSPVKSAVAFADSCPLLVMSTETLSGLNQRMSQSVPMNRFRPSLVIEGLGEFAEDTSQTLSIGNTVLHHIKPCARCVIINIEQETGVLSSNEPLSVLATYRKSPKGKVLLGSYFWADSTADVRVGDEVHTANEPPSSPLVESMQTYYKKRASEYDASMGYLNPGVIAALQPVFQFMREKLNGLAVLELACGPCFWTDNISQTARSVLATDVNDSVLDEARRKTLDWRRVSLARADAYNLPEFPQPFDAVFAVDFFCHVPLSQRKAVLEGIHRNLKPSGIVLFCDQLPKERSWTSNFDAEGNHIQTRKLSDGSQHEVIKNYPDEEQIRSIFGTYSKNVIVKTFPDVGRYVVYYQPRIDCRPLR